MLWTCAAAAADVDAVVVASASQTGQISWSNFIYVAIVHVMNTEYLSTLQTSSQSLSTHKHTHTTHHSCVWMKCCYWRHSFLVGCANSNGTTMWKHTRCVHTTLIYLAVNCIQFIYMDHKHIPYDECHEIHLPLSIYRKFSILLNDF